MSQSNALIYETSPYLLQHAKNPVHWHAWQNSILKLAAQKNKPILLSIGYSACHWCHVMAHESFEDQETADLMNSHFINIKVDREERPDIDKIYQSLHMLLTHHPGGWPLTIFLMPEDLSPIFSGTYYPKEARYQLPSFKEVLIAVSDLYTSHAAELKERGVNLAHLLNSNNAKEQNLKLNDVLIQTAVSSLIEILDKKNGGFNGAPKFPQPTKIELLLRESPVSLYMTFMKMAEGGLYDQLSGGFFRYTVDEEWRIPHFEKMLYDNAQLLYLYTIASQQYPEHCFKKIAVETADWIMYEMQMAEGGYYSSIDADTKEGEGAYYIWDRNEIESCLEQDEFTVINLYYGLDQPAFFHHRWHFYVAQSPMTLSKKLQLPLSRVKELICTAKIKLFNIRNKRIKPATDHKVLTAWNALTIKAMVIAADRLNKPMYLKSAHLSLTFIRSQLFISGRLRRSYHMRASLVTGYLDDYAYLLEAILVLLQYQWDTDNLNFAIQLADQLLLYFYDPINGGFFFTPSDQETIIYRPKTLVDEVTPTGNAIAISAMLILGYLLGEEKYLLAAEKSLMFSFSEISSHPENYCHLLMSLKTFLHPPYLIIITGEEKEMKAWSQQCRLVNSQVMIFPIPADTTHLPNPLKFKVLKNNKIQAYLCKGTQCNYSTDSLDELLKSITSSIYSS